ncbi:peptidylprolyl isomerase fpr3 [Coemansia brasiliensis]|uniref:peptidylprolyl isomerase n=1 Tax=Coemansia brasiliensis TaxID=2650707 RepID=A0A9W8IHL7_9FUNG|nr:peptidylprolyl isomerase fpr3 [Coemansia brasiliensis]
MFRGFWGLKIEPGKTYSQTVDASFRLSNAALGLKLKGNKRTSVVLTIDGMNFVLCSLTPGSIEQQSLDICLTEGEDITFETVGDNEVFLTGNFLAPEDDEDEDSDDEVDLSSLSPEQIQELIDQGLIDPESLLEDDDSEDEDYDSEDAIEDDRIKEITEEDESDLEEKEEEEKEEEVKPDPVAELKIKKQAKKAEKRKAAEEAAAAAKEAEAAAAKKAKKEQHKEKGEKKTLNLQGGVVAEVKKEGTGNGVKKGARVGMHYIGKLTNGKVFDQNTKGKPLWFRLGAGEVIKGWDVGVAGMKKGGERRLTIPAAMAYGKRGAPPDIPPNATLVFDVRLVDFK